MQEKYPLKATPEGVTVGDTFYTYPELISRGLSSNTPEVSFELKNMFLPAGDTPTITWPEEYVGFWPSEKNPNYKIELGLAVKYANKCYGELLGSKFFKRLRGAIWNEYLLKLPPEVLYSVRHSGKNFKKVDSGLLKTYESKKETIQEVCNNGFGNTVPLLLWLKMNPQECKTHFGKGLWRKLTRNSLWRNKVLVCHTTVKPDSVKYAEGVSGRRLQRCGIFGVGDLIATKLIKRNTKDSFNTARHLINDTLYMGNMSQSVALELNWSLRRWKEEHDNLVEERNRRELSSHSDKEFCDKEFFYVGGYTFERLSSPRQVQAEGLEMGHCVGSYASRCNAGEYLVLKVTNPEGERATLGLSVKLPSRYTLGGEAEGVYGTLSFSQMYGKRNSAQSQEMHNAAKELIGELNGSIGCRVGWVFGQSLQDTRNLVHGGREELPQPYYIPRNAGIPAVAQMVGHP